MKRQMVFLQQLRGDAKDMLLALTQEKGIQGLQEKEIISFSAISKDLLLNLSQELEEKAQIRILSFYPLFLLFQPIFIFFCQKILSFAGQFHKKYPSEIGVSVTRIKKRFNPHPRILNLALKYLVHEGKIKRFENLIALSDFKFSISKDEEKILKELEKMCFKGEFQSLSLEELQKNFRLSVKRLGRLISILTERKKIIKGKDGFLLHYQWLDELIRKIRESGKKELTVYDFKKMTGLSRKYAIPLLELLDQKGVTQRKGPSREVL
ncbi:SelB C-terminal domain-containing protein [Acidobacteriota bacterium]